MRTIARTKICSWCNQIYPVTERFFPSNNLHEICFDCAVLAKKAEIIAEEISFEDMDSANAYKPSPESPKHRLRIRLIIISSVIFMIMIILRLLKVF